LQAGGRRFEPCHVHQNFIPLHSVVYTADPPLQHHIRWRPDHFNARQYFRFTNCHASPRVFVDQHQQPQRSSVLHHRSHEIVTPHMIGTLAPEPQKRSVVQPQASLGPLFLWHFQAFPPPDPLRSNRSHFPARFVQLQGDSPIAVASILAGQRNDRLRQPILVRTPDPFVALCPSPVPQQPAGMPLLEDLLIDL
jgi:hypothetical protein